MRKAPTLAEIYNAIPTIRYEGDDKPVHTAENYYTCDAPGCPCQGENPFHEGECEECGRVALLSGGLCEGCTLEAMME